jgi:hypothetical protein
MRLATVVFIILVLVISAAGQTNSAQTGSRSLYFLSDSDEHWCAYGDETEWKSDVQRLRALTVAMIQYTGDRVSLMHFTDEDEAGDWIVYDIYSMDKQGKIESLTRTINIIPEDRSELETWRIQGGKPSRQNSISRTLGTLKPVEPTPIFLPGEPIITSLETLPFWAWARDKRQDVWAKGKMCFAVQQ